MNNATECPRCRAYQRVIRAIENELSRSESTPGGRDIMTRLSDETTRIILNQLRDAVAQADKETENVG